jgi:hypothetical protein
MAIKNDLLSDITAVLTAHGVSHQDWGDVCTELAARLSGAPPNFSFEAPSAPTLAERAQAPIPYDRPETGLLPPSQTPSSKADESNRIPTSRFGDIPASLKRQRSYRKRNWSDADISNSQLIAEANQLVGAYNYRRGKGEQFSEADIETYRSAKSLLSAAERRRRASKLARAKPG